MGWTGRPACVYDNAAAVNTRCCGILLGGEAPPLPPPLSPSYTSRSHTSLSHIYHNSSSHLSRTCVTHLSHLSLAFVSWSQLTVDLWKRHPYTEHTGMN